MPLASKPTQPSPKYIQLAERLRAQVKSGGLEPGDQLPSFVELRNEHGISRGTVEKAHSLLEGEGLIVREQGRGVFVAEPQLRPVTGVLGFIGGGFGETQHSLYWLRVMAGMQQEAMLSKRQLMLILNGLDTSVWDKIDGVLLSQNEEDLYATVRALPPGMPCVSILTPTEELGVEINSVQADDYQGVFDAARYLISLGHQRIAYVSSGRGQLIERRMEGYKDALQQSGIEPSLRWLRSVRLRSGQADSKAAYVEQGRRTIREWLQSDWRDLNCTALMAQNDNTAVGAIEAFQEAGIRVPEGVSVVGFDGTEMYDYFSPHLTTVQVPVYEIGAAGVRLLLQQIERRSTPHRLVLPTHLQVGASTGPIGPG
jgi:GntR family transcriptional regulator of arabinose operon